MNDENISQLERLASLSEPRGEWGAWTIIAGLVFEIGIALAVTFGFDNKLIEHWSAVFATALIAGGVYCEIHFGRKSSGAHKALRVISDGKVAEATANAARAHERAAILEKEAADARARTAEIERITPWPRISPEQTDMIVHEIRRNIPRNISITIESVNDPEAVMFSDQLRDLLINADAGGAERFARPMPADGKVEFGLSVSSEPEVYALILTEAFTKAGIPITKWATAFGGTPRMTLYVGHRPIQAQYLLTRESSI